MEWSRIDRAPGEWSVAALDATVRRAWERTGGLPIVVTENGIATADDTQGISYIREALTALHVCISDGIDIRGYTYWSLLDDFEWLLGFAPRLGIVEADRQSFRRTPKPSAQWYAEVIRRNAVPLT